MCGMVWPEPVATESFGDMRPELKQNEMDDPPALHAKARRNLPRLRLRSG